MLHAIMHTHRTIALDAITLDVIDLEAMDFAALDLLRERIELPQVKLCQRGEINPATYTRWRKWVRGESGGSKPHPRSLAAVRDVLRIELTRQSGSRDLPIAS